jgi:hypothetical protein
MARGKRYQPEQVVNLLRQIEVAVANGTGVQESGDRGADVLPLGGVKNRLALWSK